MKRTPRTMGPISPIRFISLIRPIRPIRPIRLISLISPIRLISPISPISPTSPLCPVILLFLLLAAPLAAQTTDTDDDIWREVNLKNVDYKKVRSYCQRIYAYYRCIDDGVAHATKGEESHQFRLYRVSEGICELDVRYKKEYDEGAKTLVGRNLVHPDRTTSVDMDYFELTPYTFLEKARRNPKTFTLDEHGDTTYISTRQGRIGTAVKDTAARELRIDYNALAPDTSLTLNVLIARIHLSHIDAKAVYRMEDDEVSYVPQGDLKHIVFEGDIDMNIFGKTLREQFHERTEIFVDSVVYMTEEQYRADKKRSLEQRRKDVGYTDADIDRLKQKLGVLPLTAEQLERIEQQRDWDDAYELWKATDSKVKAAEKAARKTRLEKRIEDAVGKMDD